MLLNNLGVRIEDVLPLDVLDQVELLQRVDDVLGLDRGHVAQLLDADVALYIIRQPGRPSHKWVSYDCDGITISPPTIPSSSRHCIKPTLTPETPPSCTPHPHLVILQDGQKDPRPISMVRHPPEIRQGPFGSANLGEEVVGNKCKADGETAVWIQRYGNSSMDTAVWSGMENGQR